MSSLLPPSKEYLLIRIGERAAHVTLPIIFVRSLQWTPGKTRIEVFLQDEGILIKKAKVQKDEPQPAPLPLFKTS